VIHPISQDALDRRLDPAAEDPDRFESLADELIEELDREHRDLALHDPWSWRYGRPAPRTGLSPLQHFRAEVDDMIPLDRAEEAQLARRIEFARRRLARARERAGLDPEAKPTNDEPRPRDVARRALELHALRTEMVERNLYLVLINVERYVMKRNNRQDLIQEGCLGLFRAVDGFDWRRGLLFRTYAVHWLNQAFRNHLYNRTQTVRVPVYLQKALKHINQATIRLGDPDATPAQIAEVTDLTESVVASALFASKSSLSIDAALRGDDGGSRLRDLLEMGVIDPAKVVRTALQNAASVAGLLITTECAIVEADEDSDDHGHDHDF